MSRISLPSNDGDELSAAETAASELADQQLEIHLANIMSSAHQNQTMMAQMQTLMSTISDLQSKVQQNNGNNGNRNDTAAEDVDVVTTAETTSKEATNKEAANKEADHSNHKSIAGRMAYAPMTVPPAPLRRPATRPPQPCRTCRMAAPNSVSGCDRVGQT